ncbi:MAG: translation initiation factor IF-3 [Candidatus Liptonbacteria bacterium RIFCSPLOWO2_01_FULL_52_25]|uniref:Translation initiation factor IF-3 n=1 Tax=Candidatus Liptonbacteria bacterium RIFCSPLOWO2_01_FULL_52_25 TaxID=1798650 RepID=A0A1G2CET8_9BACT|nr:MAG: translation initiation factor IF-3 [Candidatus Liptonbacteria bacterium RIFCSPLOWO2_01_FULL_52_25]
MNSLITAPELRVIDDTGKNLGVLPRDEALKLAKPELGLDLIEIVPTAKPPIARVMSYDKYRYEKEKQEKKERQAQKGGGVKHVQISARAAMNDLMIKIRQLEEFFKEGHVVEIQMRLRGREKYNKDWARLKMNEFLKLIPVEFKTLSEPRFGGQGMFMQIAKKQ